MEKETLKNIFVFLKNKEYKNLPKKYLNSLSDSELIKIFETHPDDSQFVCDGNLNLRGSTIKSLPEWFKVEGDLNLNHSDIESLPEGLEVKGSLRLIESWSLTSLPKGLYVGGNLHIQRSNFTNFSDDEIRDMIKPGFIEGIIYR